jgi:hypothetical protein
VSGPSGTGKYAELNEASSAPSTNHIIDKLIVFSVSTGALTSMCAIALLIVVCVDPPSPNLTLVDPSPLQLLKMPETFIWVGLFFVLGRCQCSLSLINHQLTPHSVHELIDGGSKHAEHDAKTVDGPSCVRTIFLRSPHG